MNRAQTRAGGFTLLEMMVAVAVLSIALALTLGLTHSTTTSFYERIREADVETKGDRILTAMREELSDSTKVKYNDVPDSLTGKTFHNAELWYQVPLKFVQTGVAPYNPQGYAVELRSAPAVFTEDKKFMLIWGWRDSRFTVTNLDSNSQVLLQGPNLRTNQAELPGGIQLVNNRTPEGFVSFRFQVDHNARFGKTGQNGLLSEADEGVDLDGDGAFTSTYAVGYVERACYVLPPGSWTPAQKLDPNNYAVVDSTRDVLGVTNVVQPTVMATDATDPAALTTNRIFTMNGSRVDVNLWLLSYQANARPYLIWRGTSIFMRNNSF